MGGVRSTGSFLAQRQFQTIIAWLAYTYAHTVCTHTEQLVVNWQSRLKMVLVAFLGEITEQTKTTENPSATEDRQSLSWGAGLGWVQGGMKL